MPSNVTQRPIYESALITGGAGFVGASVALALRRRFPEMRLVALDNLHRRGSELNLRRLREAGIAFLHGDVRAPEISQTCRTFRRYH
jgi:CDP-paratose 2-epimerase